MNAGLGMVVDTFFCIAVEEIEAWLLGDMNAILTAYPHAKRQLLQNYEPDSVIGTWEYLANAIYEGGLIRLKKVATSYYEIGAQKCEWANEIGSYLSLQNNRSPSFNNFLSKLDHLCS